MDCGVKTEISSKQSLDLEFYRNTERTKMRKRKRKEERANGYIGEGNKRRRQCGSVYCSRER